MKSGSSCERSSSRGSKDGTRAKDAARHSSPILRSMQLPNQDQYGNSGIASTKLVTNRSSNSSDISVPGQNLHTDSGISSSDSLAGGEKRSPSPDLVTELLRIADVKLAEINIKDETSWNEENDLLQTSKNLMPLSSITANNTVLPVLGSNNSDMATSMSSIFMTAMDAEVPMPEAFDSLPDDNLHDMGDSHNCNAFAPKASTIDHNDARLYCSACGDILNIPRLLPCLHTFCTECLQARVTQKHVTSIPTSGSARASEDLSFLSETLMCPICSTKVELLLEGVYALPINHMIQRLLVLHNLRSGQANEMTCDLCPDSSSIEAWCIQCAANMCRFCLQAHKRQSLTSAHTIIIANEIDSECRLSDLASYRSKKHSVPIMCQRHTSEELRLYCLDCSQLVCRDCCLGSKHRDHKCEYLDHVIDRKVSEISNEFKVCETRIQSLMRAVSHLEKSEQIIDDTADEIAGKVERHISSYIRSLQKHKLSLLASVKAKANAKKESVQSQKETLTKILKDMSHSCEFTSQLLNVGNHHEILSLKPYVLHRLQKLSKTPFNEKPCSVENFIEFRANKKVKTWIDGDTVSCLANNKRSSKLLRPGLEVDICGDVVSHALEPRNCTAHGEGVHCTRVKLPSEFVIVTKNFGGEKLESGGHDLSMSFVMEGVDQNLFKKPKVQVTDRKDGTYRILYIVYATGNYNLEVRIFGEHIHGSPFHISAVDSKSHVHSGIFHCCCFCSSGGDRNSSCACGTVMPGGYRGCGHGHEGHPGAAHWSCCGKTTEVSSCGKYLSMASVSRREPVSHTSLSYSTQPRTGRQSHTLPTRRMAFTSRQTSATSNEMYVTPGALRSQRVPFDSQQSVQTPLTKQVKTVTL